MSGASRGRDVGPASASPGEPSPRPQPDPEVRRRYRGCLLGGAVGDALGAPVEFMSHTEIQAVFGPDGVTDFTTAFDRRGAITDDTQMTLFTAEGLLRAHVQAATRGASDTAKVVSFAYLRWLRTQGRTSSLLDEEGGEPGWLIGQQALHALRVPGNTCLQALAAMRVAGTPARNESKGCGGVMRVAPVGLYCARVPGASVERAARRAFDLGVELAALTHGHPTGQVAAGAFAALVAQLARGEALPEALARVEPLVARRALGRETQGAIDAAKALARTGPADAAKIASLGEGWVAEEALAIALYATLAARDFTHGVQVAVNHDGDSDSTGAIAGDLATYPDWPVGEFHPHGQAATYWLERYPPH